MIGNQPHCDLRHKGLAKMDIKTANWKFSDLMAARNPHFVDYFTWIDLVA